MTLTRADRGQTGRSGGLAPAVEWWGSGGVRQVRRGRGAVPVRRQQGAGPGVPPGPLVHDLRPDRALHDEAGLERDRARALVAGLGVPLDALDAERLEGPGAQRPRGLGGVAPAALLLRGPVAQF